MKGTDTIGVVKPVRLLGTSNYSQGSTLTLNESIANFSQLIFQFGTPASTGTGYETVAAYPWQINSSFSTANPQIGLTAHGEKVIMTINSNTQLTYTSGSANLRCIFGIRKAG